MAQPEQTITMKSVTPNRAYVLELQNLVQPSLWHDQNR